MIKLMPLIAICITMTLSGCAAVTTNSEGQAGSHTTIGTVHNVGMSMLKTAVNNRCRRELEAKNAWRVARAAMSAKQEETVKTEICGCVSEQAPNKVTLVDVANASIDAEYRVQLAARVVSDSIQTCLVNASGLGHTLIQ